MPYFSKNITAGCGYFWWSENEIPYKCWDEIIYFKTSKFLLQKLFYQISLID
jgi:hypothetical protein